MARTRPIRPDMAQDRNNVKWVLVLSAALIASLLLSLVVFMSLYGRPNYYVGMYDTTGPVTSLGVRGETWVPEGTAQDLGDNRMVAVGQTDEGYFVYARRGDTLGGGGGQGDPEIDAAPYPYSQVYLRTREGTYQPIRPAAGSQK